MSTACHSRSAWRLAPGAGSREPGAWVQPAHDHGEGEGEPWRIGNDSDESDEPDEPVWAVVESITRPPERTAHN